MEEVKQKSAELLNGLAKTDFQHCLEQWKKRMKRTSDEEKAAGVATSMMVDCVERDVVTKDPEVNWKELIDDRESWKRIFSLKRPKSKKKQNCRQNITNN
ncbi:Hypothetical protein CINCED_3A015417 [Cinara cedri]|uniref:Uncharacterized protein n=1 Tax=Cinara cedri TaxID=506608 RepID=A0A5E4NLQ8_9HEMI|nr:Hypothetical protein CINCED_3A015417 [Cinara cedri]